MTTTSEMNRPTILLVALAATMTLGAASQAQELDYLSLTDTTMAVVRSMPVEDLQAELDAISTLLGSYERMKRDADHHKQLILRATEDIKEQIDILKTRSELAKKEGRAADRDSLEALKGSLETKRDYYERTADVREYERRHAEALAEWTKRVRTYFEKAAQLSEERVREGRDRDLLILERETIEEQKEAAKRLQDVANQMARLAKHREDMYKEREKLLNPK